MPSPAARQRTRTPNVPAIAVLGDLVVDVIVRPERPVEAGTDVPGRISLRAGGSAANTARWLARLGAAVTLISAVGRDPAGRALEGTVRSDGVTPRLARVAGARTGRIAVLVTPGERSFIADRDAADRLRAEDVRPAWLAGAALLHLPAHSLLGEPLGLAGRRAIELARAAGAQLSLDLASIGPLLANGRPAALALVRAAAPDLLFATADEAAALLGSAAEGPDGLDDLLDLVPIAVVKRSAGGATVLARAGDRPRRLEVPTRPVAALDSTGAGDAFDAGFLVHWLAGATADGSGGAPAGAAGAPARSTAGSRGAVGGPGRTDPERLRRAVLAGHRAARRLLTERRPELRLL